MPSYHLHTANGAVEIYRGKHVEIIVAQGASTKTAHFITKQNKITFFLTDIYSRPDSSLFHKVHQKHNHANLYVKFLMFEVPCIVSLYYIKNLGRPYWIYIILTHDMHQWLLLQFSVLLMMDPESIIIYTVREAWPTQILFQQAGYLPHSMTLQYM
jgi:hypothetical protein